MGKAIKMVFFLSILGGSAAGIYFGGANVYKKQYAGLMNRLKETLALSKREKKNDESFRKAEESRLAVKKFIESPLAWFMRDKHSKSLMKANFNILLSNIYYELGKFKEDDALTIEAVENAAGVEIDQATILSEMEWLQKELIRKVQRYNIDYANNKAEQLGQRVIVIAEKIAHSSSAGRDSFKKSLPYLYSILGKLYFSQNRWLDAREEYEKGLAAAQNLSEKDNRFQAHSYRQLGLIDLKLKQYARAEQKMNNALQLITDSENEPSALLAEIYHNLGEIYKAQNKSDLVGQYFSKSLETHEKVFGVKSRALLHVLIDYSLYLKTRGNTEKARQLEERARAIETAVTSAPQSDRDLASPEPKLDY